ncbi:MAG: LTA synthase family protein [Lentisphaeria bacterium]|nr:LTA synthase family protein [Lentisphaeria bacterium]
MHGKLLRKFYFFAVIAVLPAVYCLFCSTSFQWGIVIRLAGGLILSLAVLLTAALPFSRKVRMIPGGLLGFCWMAGSLAEAVSFQHSGNTFDLKYLHHISLVTLLEGAAGVWLTAVAGGVLLLSGVVAAGWLAGEKQVSFRRSILCWGCCIFLACAGSPLVPAVALGYRVRRAAADDPTAVSPEFLAYAGIKNISVTRDKVIASPGKNLVLIYLESLEDHYFDEKKFPGLLPNLSRFRAESIDFTDIRQARNADFTFGGLYSSLTGSILTTAHYAVSGTPDGRNNSGYDPDLGCRIAALPGVLQNAGYFQMLLVGHDPRFSGLDIFAGNVGYDRIFSALQIWKELGYKEFPHAVWGVRDRVLLQLAHAACVELAKQKNRPFHLSVVTVDSHHPDGFTEPEGPRYPGRMGDSRNLLHAIYAMDQWIGKFVGDLQKMPCWQDTVVVFVTDHLAMRNSLWRELNDGRERKLVFFALNAGSPRKITVPGKTFDAAPTILALLGVVHNARFPLGENLLDHPDPRRLRGNLPENESALVNVLKQHSGGALPEHFPIQLRQTPYPALLLGGRLIPLFTEWGIPQLPRGGERFVVKLSSARQILEARRLASPEALQAFFASQPDGCTYVILKEGTHGEFRILCGHPGKWREVRQGDR